jgi:hypothetical protein
MYKGGIESAPIAHKEPLMTRTNLGLAGTAALLAAAGAFAPARAASDIQIGPSGKTFASTAAVCAKTPDTGAWLPVVQAGLYAPKRTAKAVVSLDGSMVASVTAAAPAADVWLADGEHTVVVALNRRTADSFVFNVAPGLCDLPDTSGNTFSPDGTLEFAASGKSYATVTPGCALNPLVGHGQNYVNLFDNGSYLLNVSVNGVPLTQLSSQKPHTPVFLAAGLNVISAANAGLSIDYYVRDGGTGSCTLP